MRALSALVCRRPARAQAPASSRTWPPETRWPRMERPRWWHPDALTGRPPHLHDGGRYKTPAHRGRPAGVNVDESRVTRSDPTPTQRSRPSWPRSAPSPSRAEAAAEPGGSALGMFWLPWPPSGRTPGDGSGGASAKLAVPTGTHDAGPRPEIGAPLGGDIRVTAGGVAILPIPAPRWWTPIPQPETPCRAQKSITSCVSAMLPISDPELLRRRRATCWLFTGAMPYSASTTTSVQSRLSNGG